jgi:transitional endoplasmic reticulum ATPase
MADTRILPQWADDLRRRYLRGESTMFVLHGNVYDSVLHEGKLLTLSTFLTDELLQDSKEIIAVFNVVTGVKFVKGGAQAKNLEDLILATQKDRALTALERLLQQSMKVGVVVEYAESVAPAGDPTFMTESDRAAVVTLHRWSFLPEIEKFDNVIILIAENLTELSPKLISNPKVAVVEIPMPDKETRASVVRIADPQLSKEDVDRYAEVTAGLKGIQIAGILTPPPPMQQEGVEREAFIAGILGGGPTRPSARTSSPR